MKICLGDVFIFNTQQKNDCGYETTKVSPPMKVIWVDIKNPQNKELHVVLAKFNPILKIWQIDQEKMDWYKEHYNIEYFTMFEYQINRKIKLTDFKQSFKIVDTLSNWIKDTSLHYSKQADAEVSYDFQNDNIILTVKIPYKTEKE